MSIKFNQIIVVIFLAMLSGCATTSINQEFKGQSAGQIFTGGEQALAKHKYGQAVKNFEALEAMYPFGPYSEQAELDIIYAYYKNDDPASALAAADRYIRLYPRSPHVDYAYYMRGLVNYGRGRSWVQKILPTDPADRDLDYMRSAFTDFSTLLQLFPNSVYASDAKQRMLFIRNVLAQHELNVANFYLIRKTYVAAANRANSIIQNYQSSPQVIVALGVSVQAYSALGENDLAQQAMQILAYNYPNSQVYKTLVKNIHKVNKSFVRDTR